jgi:hypothetical protein
MADLGSNLDLDAPKVQKKRRASGVKPPAGRSEWVTIRLEENDEIPETGLFLGHNGIGYMLKPGEDAEVPWFLLDILDHAVMSKPIVDPQTKQVLGYREQMRYPYRRIG